MNRWAVLATLYATIGLIFGGIATHLRGSAWTHPSPWLDLSPNTDHWYSLLLGLTLGVGVAASTSTLVKRTQWARTLHEELRPAIQGIPALGLYFLAIFSSLGEELLFRSVLQTSTNIWIQALLFGLAHQLPGRARFTWVLWATIMGLLFGALFQATGSLLGPLAAHITINAMNLRFLQSYQPSAHAPRLVGGILGQHT